MAAPSSGGQLLVLQLIERTIGPVIVLFILFTFSPSLSPFHRQRIRLIALASLFISAPPSPTVPSVVVTHLHSCPVLGLHSLSAGE